jgi:hypothetical protein
MAWELPASPTCQPNGPASTKCSALLRNSGMFETSLWRGPTGGAFKERPQDFYEIHNFRLRA